MLRPLESSISAASDLLRDEMCRKGISPEPIVVGGSGGSGTRVVVELLRHFGVVFGEGQNESGDSLDFIPFLDRYAARVFAGHDVNYMEAARHLLEIFEKRLASGLAEHWAWKNPRSIFVLPLLHGLLPQMRFVHVIRHGMDIATSSNVHQLSLHGEAILGRKPVLGDSVDGAELWSKVNAQGAEWGKRLGERYLLLRYEDLCASPQTVMRSLRNCFGLPDATSKLDTPIQRPARRWAPSDCQRLIEQVEDFAPALRRFDYQC